MPDSRFFETLRPTTAGELASLTGARLAEPGQAERPIAGVAILARAGADDVSFLADSKRAGELAASAAGACFLAEQSLSALPPGCVGLVTRFPQAAYAAAAGRLHRVRRFGAGQPGVSSDAALEEGCEIAPGAVVAAGAAIGRGTVVEPGAVIGPGVAVGRDCRVGANAVIGFALLGDRVTVLAGAVIGEAGFGAVAGPTGVVDLPQLGRVILQDGVTVGANSCIDRGAFEDTVIGENTKIDNLVMVGHNSRIGRNCVLAAMTGLSGSVTIGDGCQLGGRVGIADHKTIGAGARLAANAGVIGDVPAGETWGGFPARPIKRWLRETAHLGRTARRARED